MADPVCSEAEWLQKYFYQVVEDTQTVAGHPIRKLASPNLSRASENPEGSSTDAQSSPWAGSQIAQVSDGSSISTGVVRTRNHPTSCSGGEKSKLSNAAGGQSTIDPQLLSRTPSQSQHPNPGKSNDQYNNISGSQQSRSLASSGSSLTARSNSQGDVPEPNIFDSAFRELEIDSCVAEFVLWLSQRLNRALSTEDQFNLRMLAHMPGWHLMDWLKKDMNFTSELITASANPGTLRNQHTYVVRPYRARCLDSNDRYRWNKIRSRDSKVFECTNQCGQFFPGRRKGDWERHERVNFEDWVCPECARSLRRKEKLSTHLKKRHGIEVTSLDQYRRQFLSPSERPCGFCPEIFHDWSAWLRHVGGHFEGSERSPKRKMSEWTERRNAQIDTGTHPRLSEGNSANAKNGDGEDDFGAGYASNGADWDVNGSFNQSLSQATNPPYGAPASSPETLQEACNGFSEHGIPPPSFESPRTPSQHICERPVVADRSPDTSIDPPAPGDAQLSSEASCQGPVAAASSIDGAAQHPCPKERQTQVQHLHEDPVVPDYSSGDKELQARVVDQHRPTPQIYQEQAAIDRGVDGVAPRPSPEYCGDPSQLSPTSDVDTDNSLVEGTTCPFPEDQQSRFQHLRTEQLDTAVENTLVCRMTALDVSETGIEYHPFNWAIASDVSCSCTSCEQRLHLGTSAVDAFPRPMNSQGGCRKAFIQQSYHIQQYVCADAEQDPWNPPARIWFNVKAVRPRCRL